MNEPTRKEPRIYFYPAAPSLSPEQLQARSKREKLILNSLAMVLSTGPCPGSGMFALMQRYIDGEITLDQVEELIPTSPEKEHPVWPFLPESITPQPYYCDDIMNHIKFRKPGEFK